MPVDLVREQDFILRVRRLQRLGTRHFVINLVLSAIPALVKNRVQLTNIQISLKEFAKVSNGTYCEMSNGDAFILWEANANAPQLVQKLMSVLPIEKHEQGNTERFLLVYNLPGDYTALRERSNHYVEVVRASGGITNAPEDALKSETARGPLTAWSVDQIGKLLDDVDVRTYGRKQPIYRMDEQGALHAVSEEYFISFDDLRRERFPKLDLITPEHLFFALCEMIDQRLLSILTSAHATIAGKSMHFNLSVATVIGSVFAKFTHSVPREQRGLLTFEIHRGDLFQDFARTQNAIEVLHQEGFKVALDSVTPDMLPYINLTDMKFDFIKVNVSGDRIGLLATTAVRKALQQLPADKLIFFRCDSDSAMRTGRDLGIRLFQGWHIDDLASPAKR